MANLGCFLSIITQLSVLLVRGRCTNVGVAVCVPTGCGSGEETTRALCEQIENLVEAEQKKTLWVLSDKLI